MAHRPAPVDSLLVHVSADTSYLRNDTWCASHQVLAKDIARIKEETGYHIVLILEWLLLVGRREMQIAHDHQRPEAYVHQDRKLTHSEMQGYRNIGRIGVAKYWSSVFAQEHLHLWEVRTDLGNDDPEQALSLDIARTIQVGAVPVIIEDGSNFARIAAAIHARYIALFSEVNGISKSAKSHVPVLRTGHLSDQEITNTLRSGSYTEHMMNELRVAVGLLEPGSKQTGLKSIFLLDGRQSTLNEHLRESFRFSKQTGTPRVWGTTIVY